MSTTAVEQILTALPELVGPALLELPEDQWLDRKSARVAGRDLANSMIGFANADGGFIVVGLHDEKVEGIGSNSNRQNELLQANLDFCVPPVQVRVRRTDCINERGKPDQLLVLEIQPSEMVHANQKDDVYLRVGDENRRLSFAQRQELLYDKGQSSYETRPSGAGFDSLDMSLLESYAHALRARDPIRLLQARELAVDDQLTISGCLLFAEFPQRILPEAFIRVVRYRGKDRGTGSRQQIVEDVRVEGPLPDQMEQARDFTKRLQPTRRALMEDGKFGDVALVPEDAWLEGIVNAAIHRSYSAAGDHIRVEIFDDRIEISSPGRFPGLVDVTQPLSATRFARNPRIARVCSDLDFGQELGEGIRRMFEEMRAAGLNDPIYRQTSGSVQLVLLAEPVDRQLEARLPENARRITTALREAERLSTGEIVELLGVSRPVAQRELAVLREAEIIDWVGKSSRDPRAYWRLKPT
ncbi:MAG TPA: ATP-binding protein [Solirubrobacterales bacterium]|nr:ATP-binding protein [Solirubrobacterales bacterium]